MPEQCNECSRGNGPASDGIYHFILIPLFRHHDHEDAEEEEKIHHHRYEPCMGLGDNLKDICHKKAKN